MNARVVSCTGGSISWALVAADVYAIDIADVAAVSGRVFVSPEGMKEMKANERGKRRAKEAGGGNVHGKEIYWWWL